MPSYLGQMIPSLQSFVEAETGIRIYRFLLDPKRDEGASIAFKTERVYLNSDFPQSQATVSLALSWRIPIDGDAKAAAADIARSVDDAIWQWCDQTVGVMRLQSAENMASLQPVPTEAGSTRGGWQVEGVSIVQITYQEIS